MKTSVILALAVPAALGATIGSLEALDSRACCTVTICEGFQLSGECYTGCYPKIDEVYLDPWWQDHAGSFKVSTPDCGCYARIKNGDGAGNYCNIEDNGNAGPCINNMASFHCEF